MDNTIYFRNGRHKRVVYHTFENGSPKTYY